MLAHQGPGCQSFQLASQDSLSLRRFFLAGFHCGQLQLGGDQAQDADQLEGGEVVVFLQVLVDRGAERVVQDLGRHGGDCVASYVAVWNLHRIHCDATHLVLMLLTGAALLQKIQEMGDAPRDQLAITCGYVNKAGKPAYSMFQEAILQAKGVSLAPPSTARKASRGKQPSYEVTINKQGVAPVGGAYTSLLGWAAGDKLRIAVDGGRISLERIATAEAAESHAEPPAACPAPSPAAGAPAAAVVPF